MKTSEQTEKIDAALLAVQRDLSTVERKGTADVERGGTTRSSKYVTAEAIYAACHDLLVKHGVTLWQGGERDEKGGERLLTVLASGGQQRVSSFPILCREGTGAQNFGGGLAFAKRWGLQAAVGIFPPEDQDESRGYQTLEAERRSAVKQQRAAPGIAGALDGIRKSVAIDDFAAAASRARASFPTGAEAAQVESVIAGWFVHALDAIRNLDELTDIKEALRKVQSNKPEVREAMARAGRRWEP